MKILTALRTEEFPPISSDVSQVVDYAVRNHQHGKKHHGYRECYGNGLKRMKIHLLVFLRKRDTGKAWRHGSYSRHSRQKHRITYLA